MIESQPLPEEITGILSFDFDGTLHDPHSVPAVEPSFFEEITRLRALGWVWGVNTGRSEVQSTQGFMEGKFPFLPDFLVARERELYTPGKFGRWLPVREWNKQSEKAHQKMFRKSKRALKEIRSYVENETNAQWISEVGDPAGVIATSVEEMKSILEVVKPYCEASDMMGYLHNTIYMRFSHRDYHKGSSLAEIARRCEVGIEKVFAIGDGHNDLDMLDRSIAGMIACPGNADDDVKERVRSEGGYVCNGNASVGSIEALRHYLGDA